MGMLGLLLFSQLVFSKLLLIFYNLWNDDMLFQCIIFHVILNSSSHVLAKLALLNSVIWVDDLLERLFAL
ncbi:hypothetical protein CISIN_1g035268mg [Citrus sinensis]|uniref:Uncharacterized protein n=1 Tax=Citrus sinensis TaxID=2711 RepID=A0A067DCC7_CITSI|nr:hypothetical protein CISIN_1g035268mg [Citrus sinensis]